MLKKQEWWFWLNKTGRWILGIALAIGLYNYFLWQFPEAKLPVKDWIQESSKFEEVQKENRALKRAAQKTKKAPIIGSFYIKGSHGHSSRLICGFKFVLLSSVIFAFWNDHIIE